MKKLKKIDIKRHLTEIISKELEWPMDPKTFEKNHALIWQNPRQKETGGLRLTDIGYETFVAKMDIKRYDIEFPKEFTVTNQIVIWLDRFIDSPYYIDRKSIVVFKEKTAVQLVLFSGDVQKFGLAKAMALKNTEDSA